MIKIYEGLHGIKSAQYLLLGRPMAQVGTNPLTEDCPSYLGISAPLARSLWTSALAYRVSNSEQDLATLERLASDAVSHVRRIGWGTVDHIVLSAALTRIAEAFPAVANVLLQREWRWLRHDSDCVPQPYDFTAGLAEFTASKT